MKFSTSKPKIIFYEKPGCVGNKRQKKILQDCGYELEVKNMLSEPWTKERLLEFFVGQLGHAIVNESAPAIKNGEINLSVLDKDALIALMLENPILIKRPLMAFEEKKLCGFDTMQVSEMLGVEQSRLQQASTCVSGDSCSTH